MATYFTDKTFRYFDLAQKNKNNRAWFEKNKDLYLEHVREPFAHIVQLISDELADELPQIIVDPKTITRPLRPANRAREGGLVKSTSHITLWEKKTSLFEWNPGVHLQFGAKSDDNFVGLGLYMTSGRQMSLLRNNLLEDFEEIDSILRDRKMKKVWGPILGDRFKRFPKGYDPEDSRTIYHWHKQFYVGQQLTRDEVKSKTLARQITRDLKVAIPFFNWVREAVGTYKKQW